MERNCSAEDQRDSGKDQWIGRGSFGNAGETGRRGVVDREGVGSWGGKEDPLCQVSTVSLTKVSGPLASDILLFLSPKTERLGCFSGIRFFPWETRGCSMEREVPTFISLLP